MLDVRWIGRRTVATRDGCNEDVKGLGGAKDDRRVVEWAKKTANEGRVEGIEQFGHQVHEDDGGFRNATQSCLPK